MFPELLIRGLPALLTSGVQLFTRSENRDIQLQRLAQEKDLQDLRLRFQEAQEQERQLHQSIEAERNRIAQRENIAFQQQFTTQQATQQQAHASTLEQLRQEFQKQESQFARETTRENLLLQLEQQRLNQLEIKQLDAELSLKLKSFDRQTALKTLQEQRKNLYNPLVDRVEDLLRGDVLTQAPLHIFFAPPTVRGDKFQTKQSLELDETDLERPLRDFLDQFKAAERPVIFHGGGWQTRAVHSEPMAQTIFQELKTEASIILETFSEGDTYHIHVAFWAENWTEVRYKRLFSFDWKAVHIVNPEDTNSTVQYIKLHHALAVGVLIDEYYLLHTSPFYRRPPLLPQLLPQLLRDAEKDYELPLAQKATLRAQLADYYTQLYDWVRKNGALESPEPYLELADLYLQLEAQDKARHALEQSARAFLQNRCIPQLPKADTAGLAFLTQDLALPYLSVADAAFLAGLKQRMLRLPLLTEYHILQKGQILLWQQVKAAEPEMIWVEGGTFEMGSNDGDSDEKPRHRVTLSGFMIGKYPITQAQWKKVMGNNPSYFVGDNLPVEFVSWNDAQLFLNKLNSMTGKTYRLPTEAEWEFAARGGNQSKGFKYSGSNNIGQVGRYDDNSSRFRPVGEKRANELGIHDMSGNVWEWCSDWYGSYSSVAVTNPTGAVEGTDRVLRGGSWLHSAEYCRVAGRLCYPPSYQDLGYGFRVVSLP